MGGFAYEIPVGRRRLRCGYTTGVCAAAAARGAAELLLTGRLPALVRVETPAGIPVEVEPLEGAAGPGWAACSIRKDGGDDPDATHGTLIRARVERTEAPGTVIDGGAGVGRVTRPGLDQPVGAAAINRVPRQMIAGQVQAALAAAGASGGSGWRSRPPKGRPWPGRPSTPGWASWEASPSWGPPASSGP